MKKLATLGAFVATPALAHPGSGADHAALSDTAHFVLTAGPAFLAGVMLTLVVLRLRKV